MDLAHKPKFASRIGQGFKGSTSPSSSTAVALSGTGVVEAGSREDHLLPGETPPPKLADAGCGDPLANGSIHAHHGGLDT